VKKNSLRRKKKFDLVMNSYEQPHQSYSEQLQHENMNKQTIVINFIKLVRQSKN
jgi:RNase P protein component